MRKTIQIRVSEVSHAYLKGIASGGTTISKLADEAVLLFKKEKEKNILEYEQKMAILYPNRKMKGGQKVSKTPSLSELSTISRDLKKGNWLSPQNEDNDAQI